MDLVDLLARSAGVGPEREAFKPYALQRLRALTFSGVALIIHARPPFRTGPEVPPARGALPLASPPPRPRTQLAGVSSTCSRTSDSRRV